MNNSSNWVVLMLGGNVGDTRQFFSRALAMLAELIGPVQITSSLYSSTPWGFSEQRNFLNQALVLTTSHDPQKVLEFAGMIEKELGKNTPHTNGPRTIDIDIIFYNNLIINSERLIIPHPRLHLRRFNLQPLEEIIPDYTHPVLEEKISSLLGKCEDPLQVYKLTEV